MKSCESVYVCSVFDFLVVVRSENKPEQLFQ